MQELDGSAQATSAQPPSSPDPLEAVILQLADGTIAACDPAAETLLGLTAEQIRDWTATHFLQKATCEDGTALAADSHPAILALQTGRSQQDMVLGIHHPEGNLVWLKVAAQPLFQASGSIPYGVIITLKQTTPTQWKRVPLPAEPDGESLRSSAVSASPASSNSVSSSIVALHEAIALFNLSVDLLGTASLDGTFQTVNPAFQKMLGYSIAELTSQPLLTFIHPEDQAHTIAEIEKLNQIGRAHV